MFALGIFFDLEMRLYKLHKVEFRVARLRKEQTIHFWIFLKRIIWRVELDVD